MSQEPSIFTKIINREADADMVYEDDEMIAIRDIRPKAPVHILVISKEELPSLAAAEERHAELLGRMMLRVAALAKQEGISESGYKVVTNVGADGGQIINHLHIHLLGGSKVESAV
jgi:histidine triad (HIT) family protein